MWKLWDRCFSTCEVRPAQDTASRRIPGEGEAGNLGLQASPSMSRDDRTKGGGPGLLGVAQGAGWGTWSA